ncbi:MAG TPA: zf-HC2 domain-containing protein [Thermoleophilia bacterium]|nr:zf-HC2 domain-containing protein [Thermoleophilia bacterium]
MRHRRMRRWLSAELDGELSDARRERLARHLERCPACAEYKRALARQEQAVASVSVPETSPGFYAQVRRKLASAGQTRATLRLVPALWTRRRLPQAALLVIGLLAGGWLGTSTASQLHFFEPARPEVAPESTDERVYFSTVPGLATQPDLFDEIAWESEVSLP